MISARNDEAIPMAITESVSLSLSQRITAACAGALLTSVVVTPFDVVKVRMQSASPDYVFCGRFFDQVEPCAVGQAHRCKQGSVWRMMQHIGRQEGWSSLWRGMFPTLTMAIPATVVYYVGYESIRDQLESTGSLAPLLAGGSARMVAATLVSPLELMRTRMQAYQGSMGRVSAVWSALWSAGGWWRGLGPTLWRDVPFSAIYWATYEQLRPRWVAEHPIGAFMAGAMAGMTAAFLTTPFDVVKTRRQVLHDQHQSTWSLLATLGRDEGLRGLFRGVVPRILKVAPACAIMIGTYETGKHLYLPASK